MSDVFTKEKRSQVMAAVRSTRNKATELRLVSILRAHGIKGWRRHRQLPGKPDFSFKKERLAVFVDGCFWHGCRRHCRMPTGNNQYWADKIGRNRLRDQQTTKVLTQMGWRVIRIWEHSLSADGSVAARIKSRLKLAVRQAKVTRN